MAKYVIVGASAAGIGAVEAIRKIDQTGTITVITEETCAHYSRPMISDFVSGKADIKKMKCRTDEFWKDKQRGSLNGKKATALNLTEKTVQLESGEKVAYEKFCLQQAANLSFQKRKVRERWRIHLHQLLAMLSDLAAKIDSHKR